MIIRLAWYALAHNGVYSLHFTKNVNDHATKAVP